MSSLAPLPTSSLTFPNPTIARVWNFWFANGHLGGDETLEAKANPWADDYKLNHALWFRPTPEIDEQIKLNFEGLVLQAAAGDLDQWKDTAHGCLVLVILLDQFSRNIWRASARAFAFDEKSLSLARFALSKGYDKELSAGEALFFLMPFMHSESLPDVHIALDGITYLSTHCHAKQQSLINSWKVGTHKHISLLERFGRYPHRNEALGRVSTPDELVFLNSPDFLSAFMRSQIPLVKGIEVKAYDKKMPNDTKKKKQRVVKAKPAPGSRKLKILALHGFRQNGNVFRTRTKKLRMALEDIAEFHYITSPIQYSPQGDTRDATLAAFGKLPDYPLQRVWWMSSEDHAAYEGFDTSISYVEQTFKNEGPFDGVLGFAQGGTLAAILAAMQPHGAIKFDFAIMISAFAARATVLLPYVQPGSIKTAGLHIYGKNDILVTPDRSIQLFEVFDRSSATLVEHSGGHFVPNQWPFGEINEFLKKFHCAIPEQPPVIATADVVSLSATACELISEIPKQAGASSSFEHSVLSNVLHEMTSQEQWKELQAVAEYAHSLRSADDLVSDHSLLAEVIDEIATIMGQQLRKDIVASAAMCNTGLKVVEGLRNLVSTMTTVPVSDSSYLVSSSTAVWPSFLAKHAPRMDGHADRLFRFSKSVALVAFPVADTLAWIESKIRTESKSASTGTPAPGSLDTQARHLSYQRYRKALSLLNRVLAEMKPANVSEQMRLIRESRAYIPGSKEWETLVNQPISHHVTQPEPEPVVPCTLEDLQPLISFLHSEVKEPIHDQLAFSKGTITPDGRLDLCKQVVGPNGIRPLLDAMAHSHQVKRLLLGNNIVGDGGAAAIAQFIEERKDSPMLCWYIAGNNISPEGIIPVCDALARNDKVTALWLKRNPLKPAGMVPLARLFSMNRTIQVLDLVNCGILDEGFSTILDCLSGPNGNKTLKHLYVGTNGITEQSASRVARFLVEDCVLESFFLSCNRFGDAGAEIVAPAIAANHTIQRMSFASNRIGPKGAAAFAAALTNHPSMLLFDLGFTKATVAVGELGNIMGDEGARSLAEMLKHNNKLRSLDLLHNSISQVGVNYLREALKVNRTLIHLQLTQFGKVHNEPGKEEIRAALQRNRALIPADETEAVNKIEFPDHITEIYSVYRTHM